MELGWVGWGGSRLQQKLPIVYSYHPPHSFDNKAHTEHIIFLHLLITVLSSSMSPLCCSELMKEEALNHTDLISDRLTQLQTALLHFSDLCLLLLLWFFLSVSFWGEPFPVPLLPTPDQVFGHCEYSMWSDPTGVPEAGGEDHEGCVWAESGQTS